jgi:ketosteroid isomerase-like protein
MAFLASCQNKNETKATSDTDTTAAKTSVDLPYTAMYSSEFTEDVSDADLKMVLTTYKDWETNNMAGLGKAMGDSVYVDFSDGEHLNGTNAEIMKRWSTYRDSLSSVKIDMEAWQNMYATDKKESFVVTWYKEIDTYKNGKVDSAWYHDINQIKNGKISYYRQYKRPAK